MGLGLGCDDGLGMWLGEGGEERSGAWAGVEHNLRRGAGDKLPQTDAGAVVARSERIEQLRSIYATGERHSGS